MRMQQWITPTPMLSLSVKVHKHIIVSLVDMISCWLPMGGETSSYIGLILEHSDYTITK